MREGKVGAEKVSRLLRGSPAVVSVIVYTSEDDAIEKFREELRNRSNVL